MNEEHDQADWAPLTEQDKRELLALLKQATPDEIYAALCEALFPSELTEDPFIRLAERHAHESGLQMGITNNKILLVSLKRRLAARASSDARPHL